VVIGKTNDRLKSVKLNPIVSCFYKAQLLKTAATFHLVREQVEKRGHFDLFFCLKIISNFNKPTFFVVASFSILKEYYPKRSVNLSKN